jgi:hypothetical protein
VQVAHRIDGAEVEVFAEDEGAADRLQIFPALAGKWPGLDPGVAFPLASLGDEVVFQHVEGAGQRAGIAVGPQPHVDAEYLAVAGHFGDGVDEPLADADEKFEIGN